jgi:predicted acyltransferase
MNPATPTGETSVAPAVGSSAQFVRAGGNRLVSLDVFRGITMAAMILVNNPGTWGHIYWPLEHAEWNGWTPTDLIFPFFLFIVGVAMTFSLASRVERGASRAALAGHIFRRGVLLFLIGLALGAFPDFHWQGMRIMGVLQRIGICYIAAGWLYLASFSHSRGLSKDDNEPANARDEAAATRSGIAILIVVAFVLLAGYWALMKLVPVPGYGAGHLDPDSNLAAYIDRTIMGGHLWSQSVTWDPEGLLSTLPAIATTLLGILAGLWLRSSRTGARKAAGLALVGVIGMAAGRLLHPLFPMNKNLWTSTFVIFTGGFAMLLLALCYWLVDLRGYRRWTGPVLVFGMNAIAVYVFSFLLSSFSVFFGFHDSDGDFQTWHGWIYDTYFAPHASPNNASLAFAIFFLLLCFLAAWPLYRKRIFLRI